MKFDKTLLNGYKFAWFGQRASDCLGLDRFLELDLVLCCDFGLDTSLALNKSAQIYSIEDETFIRENWTSAFLDQILEMNGNKLACYLSELPGPIHLITYSATHSLAKFAEAHKERLKLIMPDPKIKIWLDNKMQFRQMLVSLRQPQIKWALKSLHSINYNKAISELGSPFVITLPYGSASSGTFFIKTEVALEHVIKKYNDMDVLVSKYIDGISLNVNAAVLGEHIVVSYPSIQLVGLYECANRSEIYCGNDFGSTGLCPESLIRKSQESVFQIGAWLKRIGYQGIFGVDLIADINRDIVYPVDLNPRFQNSTYLLTQIEMSLDRTPLVVLNIAAQMGLNLSGFLSVDFTEMEGAQIILHNISDETVIIRGTVLPGIYIENAGCYSRTRDGFSLLDICNKGEFVVTCAVPRSGTIVKPGAPLLKILTRSRVVDLSNNTLFPGISRFCKHIFSQLNLEPGYNNKGT